MLLLVLSKIYYFYKNELLLDLWIYYYYYYKYYGYNTAWAYVVPSFSIFTSLIVYKSYFNFEKPNSCKSK